jgi:integrase
MTPDLRAPLEAQRAATDELQRKNDSIVLRGFRKAWRSACIAAGVPGRILHDFRRTAARNLERAGVPRSTAMRMVGHKTESVYRRYAIVDEAMLREGSEKLARAARAGQSTVAHSMLWWQRCENLVGRDGIEPPTPGFSVPPCPTICTG